jgi:ubiquinol-cytochrome c reductase cytochrome c1 subunit
MRKFACLIAVVILAIAQPAFAAGKVKAPKEVDWPHDGIFGTYDRAALQRGFQVYKQVCAACHSMKYLSYRNLEQIGFSPAEVKAIAADYMVTDGPDDTGRMFERPARPTDRFVSPYPNEAAARYANGGAYPPDMSLLVKARKNGDDYVYSVLTGYKEPPEDITLGPNMHYNPYYPGKQIAMAQPLIEGIVSYDDGTKASVDQMARDVTQFLTWAAEPHMETRKRMGIKVLLYLIVFTGVMIAVKKKLWQDVK